MRTSLAAACLIVLVFHLHPSLGAINSGKTISGKITEELPCSTERPCSGCGNGVCDYPAESCVSCPADCGVCAPCVQRCGNGVCEGNETSCSCPDDCGVCCVDGICNAARGETFSNCAADCTISLNISVVDSALFNLLPDSSLSCTSAVFPIGPLDTASGNYRFENIPPGIYECTASKFSYLPNSITIGVLPQTPNVTVRIPLAQEKGAVQGITFDQATNAPLPNTQVYCSHSSGFTTATVRSNEKGEFVYPNSMPGNWQCFGSRLGYASTQNTGTLLSGGHVRIDLILRSVPASVAGYVTDLDTQTPVLAPILSCVQTRLTRGLVGNDQGYYIAGNVDPENITCSVSADGYFPQTKSTLVPVGVQVIMNFSLAVRPSFIFGEVIDSVSGSLLPNVSVTCQNALRGERSTASSSNGNYSLTSGISVGLWSCVAFLEGWFPRNATVGVRAGTGHYLPFVLEPLPATLRGTVVSAADLTPVLQADVKCVFTLLPNLEPDLGPIQSNSTGQFSFEGILFRSTLLQLTFTCMATKTGFGAGSRTGIISRGEVRDIQIPMIKLGLNVVVRDSDTNLVIAGASVTCAGPTPSSGTSAGDGTVLFLGIQVGTYICSATLPFFDGANATVIIIPTSGVVTVPLLIGLTKYTLRGTITDAVTGDPLLDSTLIIRDETGTIDIAAPVILPPGANWSARVVLPASYVFFAENGPNYIATSPIVPLTPSSASRPLFLNIVPDSSTITGFALSNATKADLANCLLDLFQVDSSGGRTFIASAVSDGAGQFTFQKIKTGRFVIRATAEGFITSEVVFNVARLGITVSVEVPVDPDIYGRLTGRVVETLAGGVVIGIAGANVSVTSTSGTLQTITNVTNSEGVYFFRNVLGGSATATASKAGYSPRSISFSVAIGTTNTVNDIILAKLNGRVSGIVYKGSASNKLPCRCFAVVQIFPEGVPPTGASVGSLQITTDSPGFDFPALQEGKYYLTAADPNNPSKVGITPVFTVSATTPVVQEIFIPV